MCVCISIDSRRHRNNHDTNIFHGIQCAFDLWGFCMTLFIIYLFVCNRVHGNKYLQASMFAFVIRKMHSAKSIGRVLNAVLSIELRATKQTFQGQKIKHRERERERERRRTFKTRSKQKWIVCTRKNRPRANQNSFSTAKLISVS